MKETWTEKYRPKTLAEYVFRDERQKRQCEQWVKDGVLNHLMFSGTQGTGKTTLAKVLLDELQTHPGDRLFLNASHENSVDTVRDKIIGFAATIPIGPMKYIILDEADNLSHPAQKILRGILEQYDSVCRFITTLNYAQRIIPALHSRFQGFHIESLNRPDYAARAATILINEKIDFDPDVFDLYVRAAYPDLRKVINLLQQNSLAGQLVPPQKNESFGEQDYRVRMAELFKEGKIIEARKLITSQVRSEEYEDLFRFFYQNLDFWGDSDEQKGQAIIAINDGQYKHTFVADPEINLSATLIKLESIRRGTFE